MVEHEELKNLCLHLYFLNKDISVTIDNTGLLCLRFII